MSLLKIRIAAIMGFLSVALGALGAHKLHPLLLANGTPEIWEKAAHYHMAHAIVLLVLGVWEGSRKITVCTIAAGTIFFSGSLYIYALTTQKFFMYLTPIGGVLLLIGWGTLVFFQDKCTK